MYLLICIQWLTRTMLYHAIAQGFLKDCLSHASSDPRLTETMITVLSSQMFERFIEERLTEPDHPQIKVRGWMDVIALARGPR